MLLAGIDIGTNTLRLLIVKFSPDGRRQSIESHRRITRLGEDISRTGRLKAEAMERTLRTLKDFTDICDKLNIDGVYTVATSAVREASNAADFVGMVREKTGLDVAIISGDEEARLTMLGVSSGIDIGDKDVFLMDIGGGSTEFIFASGGRILYKVSTDIGVVRFTEMYIHSDPPREEEIKLFESAIEERLGTLPGFLSKNMGSAPLSNVKFIGTAGTVTTLAAIEQGMRTYDPDKVHGYRMKREGIEDISRRLSRMTEGERKKMPGVEKGREDIIIAGAIVCRKVMEWYGFSEMIVSDCGLREGVVMDLYDRLNKN